MVLLSTHSHDSEGGGKSDLPVCSQPASFSVHLAIISLTPAGYVHTSRGDIVVILRRPCVSMILERVIYLF